MAPKKAAKANAAPSAKSDATPSKSKADKSSGKKDAATKVEKEEKKDGAAEGADDAKTEDAPVVAQDTKPEVNGDEDNKKVEANEKKDKTKTKPTAKTSKKATATDKKSTTTTANEKPNTTKKRKAPASASTEQPSASKSSRRSGRNPSSSKPTTAQLLTFLLHSPTALTLSRPGDENDALAADSTLRSYTSSTATLTPFEELLAAVVLSRPISHKLGLRSLRTILNAPYEFTSAKKIRDAGEEKRHQALWDAKTQHKGKTADQIGLLADVVLERFAMKGDEDGQRLKKAVVEDGEGDVDEAVEALQKEIKGFGRTGVDIFLRRVQWMEEWKGGFPFVDGRTRIALQALGLPGEAEELKKVVESSWADIKGKVEGKGEEEKKRRAFVLVLERAIGADLEGNAQNLLAAAAEEVEKGEL